MLVGDLEKGQLLRPKDGKFYLYQDTWVDVPTEGLIVYYDIATIYPWRALRTIDGLQDAPCAVYVGKTYDPIKIVGTYTSYNLLIDGKIYKFSGSEFKNVECISSIGESRDANKV